MSGGSGDKSEKPTATKLRKAREKGDIPRSKDVTMGAGLIASLFTVPFFFPYYLELIQASFISMQQMATRLDDNGALSQFMLTNVLIIIKFLATLLPIPVAATLASVVPGGWVFVPTRIKPDIKKINPISGVKRLFSGQHYIDVVKMIVKCGILLSLLYVTIKGNLTELIGLQSLFLKASITHGLSMYESLIRPFIITIALFAFIDIPVSRFFFTKKMKMTKKDVRDEYKNQEGNPQIKGRIRQIQRQMAMGQINANVPQADVVITNPTHFAVALKYDPEKAAAPYIVAKGVDDVARYIRSVAEKHQVEIVEFPPLARSIYHSTRVNQQIPASLFRAMAHVLTYVMQLKSWRAGEGEKPQLDRHVPIPKEGLKPHGKLNAKNLLTLLRQFSIGVPVLLLSVLAMVILPLSPLVLDILFTFNIVLSIMVLLSSVNSKRPLDFSVFPTVLLVTTLMRLTLNVASTRVVLLKGHEGVGAAGKVIEAFGNVVIGGNFVVGFVVFIILMIINFVVVTKGAERISEVSARFTLDALPGKQMAIDADLNAGLINQEQARVRRKEVADEADFYGAMDGASKFVRGDAIAGIMILLINIVGGILIGIFKYNLEAGQAFEQYVLLTIGDGLVAQIPSLLLATAAAIIVTRVSDGGEISDQVQNQLLAKPTTIYTAALVMFVLAVVPGMPHLVFLIFTALLLFIAWRQSKVVEKPQQNEQDLSAITRALDEDENYNVSWDTIPVIEPIGLNLGYKLVTLVDKSKGSPLTQRVRGVRQVVSETSGVLLPEIAIREDFRLKPAQYAIKINGVRTAVGEVHADRLMAIPTAEQYGEIDGVLDTDPAYGLAVTWISPELKAKALNFGYQVVDCASVVATHVNKVARENLPELFNYDDITRLNERLASMSPKLAEDLNAALNFSQLLRIYRLLLNDQVSLKDIITIATTLLESAAITKDPILLASDVRYALRRAMVAAIAPDNKPLSAFTLDNELENMLLGALTQAQQAGKVALDSFPVDPNILTQLQSTLPVVLEQLKAQNMTPVLLVTPQLRPLIARYAKLFASGLHVLSYNEVPDEANLQIVGNVN